MANWMCVINPKTEKREGYSEMEQWVVNQNKTFLKEEKGITKFGEAR